MERQVADKELDALNAQIEVTKERIIDVLAEIDDINYQQNPIIEADYAVKIGYLENAVFKAELAMRRAKRKLSLIQARINAGDAVAEEEVEEELDIEFEEWQQEIQTAIDRYYALVNFRSLATAMPEADGKELKRLYRIICKRLHPDVCSPESEYASLFPIALQAYANGDIDVLRSLVEVIGEGEEDEVAKTEDEAAIQLAILEAQLAVHEEELQMLKRVFPYVMKDKLGDRQWVTDRARELKKQREERDKLREGFEARIKRALEGGDSDV